MPASVHKIVLTSGVQIVPSANVTLIVGPNNVGKSAVLAGVQFELSLDVGQPKPDGPVESVAVSLDPDEFLLDHEGRYFLQPPGVSAYGQFNQDTYVFETGYQVVATALPDILRRPTRYGGLAGTFLKHMGPEGRGQILGSQSVPDLMNPTQARSPMQKLWSDLELEEKLNDYMERAFGQPLTVNRSAGINVHMHMGTTEIPVPRLGEKSPYLEEVMRLPLVSNQGSGIQAFMGTVLELAAGRYDVVLLDEPETFLHPPQARLLGEVVASMSQDATGPQVIVATHSDDFVQGVLSASKGDSDVVVARLTRPSASENRVAQIDPDAIKQLYGDPLLRFSNIMDGIFYKGVVLCEAESDCTYYSAVLAHIEEVNQLSSSDLLFSQCGGKDRFAKAYAALNAAEVPTAVIADVDLLADRQKFKKLFEAMGGNFQAIEPVYNTLDSSVRDLKIEPKLSDVRGEIEAILSRASGSILSKSNAETIVNLVKHDSGWKQLKKKGKGTVEKGDPTQAFDAILSACKDLGLFVLEVGELERFHPEVSGNKQEWLRKVLEASSFKSSGAARSLLEDVRSFIGRQQ